MTIFIDGLPGLSDVTLKRTTEALQAKQYYSDAFPVYDTLSYGTLCELRTDKQETYSVEAANADLRHDLKCLARKSRYFSRRMQFLARNFRLFTYYYNQRQLAKRTFPKYSFHVIDFLSPLVYGVPHKKLYFWLQCQPSYRIEIE